MNIPPLKWSLNDPGMDLLERAGLAGLYMTLQAAIEAGHNLAPLKCTATDLTATSVTVSWDGPPKAAFEKLMAWAWQVREGVLFFPAVHQSAAAANWHLRVPMHNGIMRTYLQHPNVQPKLDAVTRVVQIDEEKRLTFSYETPAERVDDLERGINPKNKRFHKKKVASTCVKPHDDIADLFTSKSQFKGPTVSLSNWVYPGIAGRYGNEKSWVGSAQHGVLLMLAPTICLYQRLQGEGSNWAVVVPDVRDLEAFSDARMLTHLAPEFVDAASLGDAGLKFAVEFGSKPARRQLNSGCRVMAMGYVKYYQKYYQGQSIRKSVLDVPHRATPMSRYRRLHAAFPNHFVRRKEVIEVAPAPKSTVTKSKKKAADTNHPPPKGNGWYKLPTGRGRIADNLVSGRPWYRDLFFPLSWDEDEIKRLRGKNPGFSAERLWFHSLSFQRDKLMSLIESPEMWDDPNDRSFVEAFWLTLRSLYRIEAKAAKDRGGARSVKDRWKHLIEEVRRKLMESRTQRTSRAALADLFGRGGSHAKLKDHAAVIWRLMDHHEHWERGRDLALLAMVSYQKKKSNTNPLSTTPTQGA